MTETADILTHLATAIMTKFSGSAFSSAINGRLFQDDADDTDVSEGMYAVFSIISKVPEKTFSEEYADILWQLSIFSAASSPAEIKDAYTKANALFDECELTITGSTLVENKEVNMTPINEEHTTTAGTQKVRHYAVDYEAMTKHS